MIGGMYRELRNKIIGTNSGRYSARFDNFLPRTMGHVHRWVRVPLGSLPAPMAYNLVIKDRQMTLHFDRPQVCNQMIPGQVTNEIDPSVITNRHDITPSSWSSAECLAYAAAREFR